MSEETKIYNGIQSKEILKRFMMLNPNMSHDQLVSVYCMLISHDKKDYVPLFLSLIRGEQRKMDMYKLILTADHNHDELKEHIVVQDSMGHVLSSLPNFDRNVIHNNTRSILVSASVGMNTDDLMTDDDVDEIVNLMKNSKPKRQKMEVSDLSDKLDEHFNDWAKDFMTSTGIDFRTAALPEDSVMDFENNTDAALIYEKHAQNHESESHDYDMDFERFMDQDNDDGDDDDSDIELPLDI